MLKHLPDRRYVDREASPYSAIPVISQLLVRSSSNVSCARMCVTCANDGLFQVDQWIDYSILNGRLLRRLANTKGKTDTDEWAKAEVEMKAKQMRDNKRSVRVLCLPCDDME